MSGDDGDGHDLLDGTSRSVVADRLRGVLDAGDLEVRWSPRYHLATGAVDSYRAELAWRNRDQAWFRGPGLMTLFVRAQLARRMVEYVRIAADGDQLDAPVVLELDANALIDAVDEVTDVRPASIVLVTAASIAEAGANAIAALRDIRNQGVMIGLSGLPVAPVAATLVDAVLATEIALGRRGDPLPGSDARALVLLAHAAKSRTSAAHLSSPELVERAIELGVDVGEGRALLLRHGGNHTE